LTLVCAIAGTIPVIRMVTNTQSFADFMFSPTERCC
jgi:hypothetical protein